MPADGKWDLTASKGLIEPVFEIFPESPPLKICFQRPRNLKCFSRDGPFLDRAEPS
jgi:hypothetical protein